MRDDTDPPNDALTAERLPAVPVRHLLWNIPQKFGGLTNAVLRRVTMLSNWADRDMEILLLGPSANASDATKRLKEIGLINDRVHFRGMWEELRRMSDSDLMSLTGVSTTRQSISLDNAALAEKPPAGNIREHRRTDGSLLALELTFPNNSRTPSAITLFDHAEKSVAHWKDASGLSHAWLDLILGTRESILVSDSPVTGGAVHNYRRSHITVLQALHNTHVKQTDPTKLTPAGGKFFELLTHTDNFDRFVTLTTAQRHDMESSLIGSDNLTTVPNTFTGEPVTELIPRARTKGVIAARLEPIKRLDHIIQAVAAASGKLSPTLDVYGDGAEERNLRTLIDQLQLKEKVAMRGFDPQARDAYKHSSFTFLTSKSEGQPLVLLESMAAGCIPIAYDIDYGPGDIITNGVNGFLVPPGDIAAVTEALKQFLSMSERDVQGMREAAVRRAAEYHWEHICEKWAMTYREAIEAKKPIHRVQMRPTLRTFDILPDRIHLEIDVTGKDSASLEWALLTWVGRKANTYGRAPAQLETTNGRTTISCLLPVNRLTGKSPTTLDIYVDVRVEGTAARRRIKVPESLLPNQSQRLEAFRTINGNLSVKVAVQD